VSPLAAISLAWLLAGSPVATSAPVAALPIAAPAATVVRPEAPSSVDPDAAGGGEAPAPLALAPRPAAVRWQVGGDTTARDTVPRPRRRAVQYSDGYATRVQLHRALSWGMLPLFALSYLSGDQMIRKGGEAPAWARRVHAPAAATTAVLFGANAVTGVWNLWEGRQDPNGRVRRFLHSATFLAASGGFTYAGSVLADEARQSPEGRRRHRTVAVSSMALSTASWLVMLVGN
jgi:hypothetical protein